MADQQLTSNPILCPACGCEFESERELQSHDAIVHGVGEYGADADREMFGDDANYGIHWGNK